VFILSIVITIIKRAVIRERGIEILILEIDNDSS